MSGGVYHLWARGNWRERIFVDDEDRREYLDLFGQAARTCGWRPLAYCLMTNHVHHLVELTEPVLGSGIQQAHCAYARKFHRRHKEGGGHLFEKRFGSSRARNDGIAMYFACYVLLNPVVKAMCARPEDYRWSSCPATLGLADGPPWLEVDRLLEYFGSRQHFERVLEGVRIMGAAGFEPATSRV